MALSSEIAAAMRWRNRSTHRLRCAQTPMIDHHRNDACGSHKRRRDTAGSRRPAGSPTGSAKRAQRRVPCQGLRSTILPARSAAVGVPTVRPAAGATPRSGLVQTPLQRPCHHGAPPRQAVPLCEEAQPRTKTPRHTTIRHAARRAVNALFGYFLALGQKVTRPGGRNQAVQQPTACHQQRQTPKNRPQNPPFPNPPSPLSYIYAVPVTPNSQRGQTENPQP
ncbi:hypothetical protein FHX61_003271 [Cupriavidus alkaliphilus]|uniref:Uncharacterized protein n=1 Tax=Cupriavidus alkaliphilus TaxID=942866 RepID=A0A7W4VCM6_9BURK|nr:hypothetical protein [Cupriavidus alkaliphilus]